jgi:hypothetical protein
MKKRERNGVSKEYLFCLSDVSLQRYDSANRRPILEKTLFHTVGCCTLWPKQLTCLADGGGWREDQHMWDGQGLKDPCFFKLFLESQNHRKKLNLWGRNWVHWQDNFLKEDWIFFWIFWHIRHFRAISLWKKRGPFRPWSFSLGLSRREFKKILFCSKYSLPQCWPKLYLFIHYFFTCRVEYTKYVFR